jgi:NADH:ubiquinone oxidoreductase subunit 5 (subunit L)/multisubunit Na+/H+ antiporter MnhA subunit
MGANGAVLLAVGLAGESAATIIVAGSVGWALGVAVLSLTDGWRRESPWWNVPALVGVLSLLGMPLTLGFVTVATLFGEIVREGRIEWGGVIFWATLFGYLFLIPSLVRRLLISPPSPLPDRWGLVVARGVGLGLPALLLVAAGLYSPLLVFVGSEAGSDGAPALISLFTRPGLVGWLLWAVGIACGGLLAWQEKVIRARMGLLLGAIHDVLRLEWFYSAVAGAFDRGLSLFRVANEVVGGAGALLWSLLLFLLLLLVWGGL